MPVALPSPRGQHGAHASRHPRLAASRHCGYRQPTVVVVVAVAVIGGREELTGSIVGNATGSVVVGGAEVGNRRCRMLGMIDGDMLPKRCWDNV